VVVDVLVVGTRLGGPSLDLFGVTNNNYQWWVLMEAIRNLT
jgi:hypothetical protein